MAEAVDMTARRQRDSQQFKYTVRGHTTPDLSGSIPRQTFEAEPNSILNKMYNGDWAYATDEAGRACINSNPAHWPLILDWLSFGNLPETASEGFLAECKYWQLDNLLSQLQQRRAASAASPIIMSTDEFELSLTNVRKRRRTGFLLQGKINNFINRFDKENRLEVDFKAFGSSWRLLIDEDRAYLAMLSGPLAKATQIRIYFGEGPHQRLCVDTRDCDLDCDGEGWGDDWPDGFDLQKLQRPPYVNLRG